MRKFQLILIFCVILAASGGGYYWLKIRETADGASQKLAEQNIDVTPDAFFTEIKAAHVENIHYFIVAGAGIGTQVTDGGTTALMLAVDSGNKQVVNMLLSALQTNPQDAAKINLQEVSDQKTALIIAAEKGDPDMVNMLLAYGADISVTDKTGETPIIVAIKHNFPKLLPVLIAGDLKQHGGATINVMDTGGETPLTYAIRAQNPEMVDTLIAAKADAASADRSGVTPMMVAAEAGNETVGAKLIAAGAKLDTADHAGNTPLTIALRHAHPSFARFLLDKGAGVDFRTTGTLPLQAAISADPFDAGIFSYLLTHSKEATTIDASLVFDAIEHKNSDLVKALLEHGVDAKSANARGETLLYRAIENVLEDSAVLLIDKGANIYQTGVPGITPLERAAKHNEIKVTSKLIEMGVPPDQKTAEGYTVAEMAVYSGYPEILDVLLAKGAKLEKDFGILWSIRDGGGKSVPSLLKYGAKPTVMSNSGDPALWLAASAGETEAVQALIKYHALIDAPNSAQGMTPLAIASHGGKLDVVKLLVEAGANIEAPDAFGMTPLAHAAYMTKPSVVEYLISKGAKVQSTDRQGRSITDLAFLGEASNDRDKVISLLQVKK